MSLYTGQRVKIELTCTIDGAPMSTASSGKIAYRRPDGTTGEWEAVVNNGTGKLTVTVEPADLSQAGQWILQPLVTIPVMGELPGTPTPMPIKSRFS